MQPAVAPRARPSGPAPRRRAATTVHAKGGFGGAAAAPAPAAPAFDVHVKDEQAEDGRLRLHITIPAEWCHAEYKKVGCCGHLSPAALLCRCSPAAGRAVCASERVGRCLPALPRLPTAGRAAPPLQPQVVSQYRQQVAVKGYRKGKVGGSLAASWSVCGLAGLGAARPEMLDSGWRSQRGAQRFCLWQLFNC